MNLLPFLSLGRAGGCSCSWAGEPNRWLGVWFPARGLVEGGDGGRGAQEQAPGGDGAGGKTAVIPLLRKSQQINK